jgi:hypothetical protein
MLGFLYLPRESPSFTLHFEVNKASSDGSMLGLGNELQRHQMYFPAKLCLRPGEPHILKMKVYEVNVERNIEKHKERFTTNFGGIGMEEAWKAEEDSVRKSFEAIRSMEQEDPAAIPVLKVFATWPAQDVYVACIYMSHAGHER